MLISTVIIYHCALDLILHKVLKFFFPLNILFQNVFVVAAVLLTDVFIQYFRKDERCFLHLHLHHEVTTALLTDTTGNLCLPQNVLPSITPSSVLVQAGARCPGSELQGS